MKTLRLTLLLILPLLAAECIKDDLNSCPPAANTTVYFILKDKAGNDILGAVVDNVELFVYDGDGRQAVRTTVTRSELALFAGKRLHLDPGTYTVVVWANASARSYFYTHAGMHYLDRDYNHLITAVAAGGAVADGDPLYYAPKAKGTPLTVVVPTTGNAEVTAHLRHAHVKLEITVEGYDHVSSRAAMDPLKMEITGLTSRYDFGMAAHGSAVSYTGDAPNTDPENKVFHKMFNIPVFDRTSTTDIRITNNAGRPILSPISIVGLLGDRINLEELQHLPVRIRYTEEDGVLRIAVTVDLPEWGEDVVEPNI